MADIPSVSDPARLSLDAPFDIVPDIARFEPPDVMVFRPMRPLLAEDAKVIAAFVKDVAPRTGGLFSVTDASGGVAPGSMSSALEFNRQFNARMFRGAAVVNASYRIRVFAETLKRAAALLKLEVAKAPLRFFDDLASARAWFDELRSNRD